MDFPGEWLNNQHYKMEIMRHFEVEEHCPNFVNFWNKKSDDFKSLFCRLVVAVHNAGFDWYGTEENGGDLRIGYLRDNPFFFAKIIFTDLTRLIWEYPGDIYTNNPCYIDIPLINRFSDSDFVDALRIALQRDGVSLRDKNSIAFWPDGRGEGKVGEEKMTINGKLNTILYGPPGTGKTHSVTALALSIVSEAAQQSQYNSSAIMSGKPPIGHVVEWARWVGDFNDFVKRGRIEVTTFHQNYSYEDFMEGLKASVTETGDSSSVVYKYESGILKRLAYRALYSWLTGEVPKLSEMSDIELDVVSHWLEYGRLPDTVTVQRTVNGFAPPYVLIIDEINRGNVARILGELITLVEPSKRARLDGEIELGHQPLPAILPYTKKPFILPPNLYIIGTMNTADRSLVGLDAALRRRFEFVELAPQPELLKMIGTAGDQVDLKLLLKELNRRIFQAENSTDHEIGHAYFLGVENMEDLAAVMSRQVIPQLREYFFDQSAKIHNILAPVGLSRSPFIDDRERTVIAELRVSANFRRLYGDV